MDVALATHRGLAVCLPLVVEQPPPTALDLWIGPSGHQVDRQAGERVEWVCSTDTAAEPDPLAHDDWEGFADRWCAWRPMGVLSDGTAGLIGPCRAAAGTGGHDVDRAGPRAYVPLPPAVAGPHHWLALRLTNDPSRAPTHAEPPAGPPHAPQVELRLARMQLNTAPAVSVQTITGEELGPAPGTARLVLRLARGPVHVPPGGDGPVVSLSVAGEPWTRVDWFPDGPGKVCLLDPVTAELTFGDHDPVTGHGRGRVPPAGAAITVSYRQVSAGANGNVPAGAITVLSASGTRLPGAGTLTGVTNPVAAAGGADEEPVEEAIRRVPDALRDRGRAVTVDDYERITRTAAPGIATVRALAPRLLEGTGATAGDPWTFGGLVRAPGTVNVIVVPDLGPDVPEPAPSLALVHDVLRALDVARPAATALRVAGPRYIRVAVTATVQVFDAAVAAGRVRSKADECARIAAAVRAFLHPVHGGEPVGAGRSGTACSSPTSIQCCARPTTSASSPRSCSASRRRSTRGGSEPAAAAGVGRGSRRREPGASRRLRAGLRRHDHRDPGAMTRPASDPDPGRRRSGLLDHLPAVLAGEGLDTRFSVNRLLLVVEQILRGSPDPADPPGLEEVIDRLPELVDPYRTPDELLPWLGSWLGVSLPATVDQDQRRVVAGTGPALGRRGLVAGLDAFVDLGTSVATRPRVVLDEGSRLLFCRPATGPDVHTLLGSGPQLRSRKSAASAASPGRPAWQPCPTATSSSATTDRPARIPRAARPLADQPDRVVPRHDRHRDGTAAAAARGIRRDRARGAPRVAHEAGLAGRSGGDGRGPPVDRLRARLRPPLPARRGDARPARAAGIDRRARRSLRPGAGRRPARSRARADHGR